MLSTELKVLTKSTIVLYFIDLFKETKRVHHTKCDKNKKDATSILNAKPVQNIEKSNIRKASKKKFTKKLTKGNKLLLGF